jgi:hypothetical protein
MAKCSQKFSTLIVLAVSCILPYSQALHKILGAKKYYWNSVKHLIPMEVHLTFLVLPTRFLHVKLKKDQLITLENQRPIKT